jgi:hypothetical protein
MSNFLPLDQYFHNDFVAHLNNAPKLKAKFEAFFNMFKVSSAINKSALIKQFYLSQDINIILNNIAFDGNQIKRGAIPLRLRKKVSDLFSHLYPGTLNSLGNLTDHYTKMYDSLASKVCPFCGIEPMQVPHYARQDYDHMLNQATYPFTAVNMYNLVPMGDQCNRTYKGGQDILYNGINRRQYAYPYSTFFPIQVDLTGSTLPDRNANFKGTWVINFAPTNHFITTWAEIFKIRHRYGELILSNHFDDWLEHFIDNIKSRAIEVKSTNDLIGQFQIDANLYNARPFVEFNIVKAGLFRFLANCNNNALYTTLITRINT